jgi:hypothetical protein
MTFTESNTVEAYLRDLLCGAAASENPLNLQDARGSYGVAGKARAGATCRRWPSRASRRRCFRSRWCGTR